MRDEELDVIIAERFKAYEAGMHLPDEFKRRFVGSVRRKRTLWRAWMFGLLCITAAVCTLIVQFGKCDPVRNEVCPTLRANTAVPTNETSKVSCWMLLGYLRECFSRSRLSRRKEEEE